MAGHERRGIVSVECKKIVESDGDMGICAWGIALRKKNGSRNQTRCATEGVFRHVAPSYLEYFCSVKRSKYVEKPTAMTHDHPVIL